MNGNVGYVLFVNELAIKSLGKPFCLSFKLIVFFFTWSSMLSTQLCLTEAYKVIAPWTRLSDFTLSHLSTDSLTFLFIEHPLERLCGYGPGQKASADNPSQSDISFI